MQVVQQQQSARSTVRPAARSIVDTSHPGARAMCHSSPPVLFQHFMAVTGAHVFWGDQCGLEWKPFTSAPLPPKKTTQWMATEMLREGGEQMAAVLRCPDHHDHHDHSGGNSLVGGPAGGRFRTAGSEQYFRRRYAA